MLSIILIILNFQSNKILIRFYIIILIVNYGVDCVGNTPYFVPFAMIREYSCLEGCYVCLSTYIYVTPPMPSSIMFFKRSCRMLHTHTCYLHDNERQLSYLPEHENLGKTQSRAQIYPSIKVPGRYHLYPHLHIHLKQ